MKLKLLQIVSRWSVLSLMGLPLVASAASTQPTAAPAKPAEKHSYADTRATFPHRINIYDEDGRAIVPTEKQPFGKPYSPAKTCGKCHDYESIHTGWHFNAFAGAEKGRPGEPWMYLDTTTRTQIPLSYRGWTGTWKPADIGLTDFNFVLNFGRHLPGGGVGENGAAKPADPKSRWHITGRLEIDCMICHAANTTHDYDTRAKQIGWENFQWAPTVAMGLGHVKGKTLYAKSLPNDWNAQEAAKEESDFDPAPQIRSELDKFEDGHVFFPITRRPTADRCYICHTTESAVDRSQRWHSDRDVHLQAGLLCVDCHRNGMNHAITRGYEKEGEQRKDLTLASLSCKGCHMGVEDAGSVTAQLGGRLGAPRPQHVGLPTVHFEKLTCTACHSGSWPSDSPEVIQTSLAHARGVSNQTRMADSPPKIVEPIFLYVDGKIAPHKMVWPNFWARMEKDTVKPINPTLVKSASKGALPAMREAASEGNNPLTEEQISKTLEGLAAAAKDAGEPVYISGGKLYKRLPTGKLSSAEHPAAAPYAWPLAHDVRPAQQALGVRGCTDCHSTDSAIMFGKVAALGPVSPDTAEKTMCEMRGDSGLQAWSFASSFTFRPLLKILSLSCAGLIGAVLTLYGFKGLGSLIGGNRNHE